MKNLNEFYKDKVILVTGGAGSIGSEIVRKVLVYNPKVVRVLDISENSLFKLSQRINSKKIRLFIGDIRDKDRLKRAIEDVDIVFHTAALKHVPLCEYNPFEAVKTNIVGTQNLIEVAIDEEVEKFITISTDKAVNPTNVMGATKLLVEKLTISANFYKGSRKSSFSCVRFGNVLGSSGSVFQVFLWQIRRGGPVTITDPNMTRFVMSIHQAVDLVLKATEIAKGGEIFVLKMPSIRIIDLAMAMIEEIAPKYGYNPKDIKIKIVGKRPGEKIHEELITKEEAKNIYEINGLFVIIPEIILQKYKNNFKKFRANKVEISEWVSNKVRFLSKEEIKELIRLTYEDLNFYSSSKNI